MHCEVLGRPDSPAVLFLHGLAGSGASWGEPFRDLADEFRVVIVDLLGFGQSPKPVVEYSITDHLLALRQVLASHNITRTHIVGHSLGALLGLAFCARFPEETGRLVLLATPYFRNEAEARAQIARSSWFNRWMALETPLAHAVCTLMCLARPMLLPVMPRLMRDVPAAVARDSLRHNWTSYSRTLKHVLIEAQPERWLGQSHAPILFVQGLADVITSGQALHDAVGSRAGSRLELLEAGHDLIFTHGAQLAKRIRTFLSISG